MCRQPHSARATSNPLLRGKGTVPVFGVQSTSKRVMQEETKASAGDGT
jgi:hypothetical protein